MLIRFYYLHLPILHSKLQFKVLSTTEHLLGLLQGLLQYAGIYLFIQIGTCPIIIQSHSANIGAVPKVDIDFKL